MRFTTFDDGGTTAVGVVQEDTLYPLPAGLTMRAVLDGGLAAALDLAEQAVARPGQPLTGVRLLAPLEPASVRDFVTFEEHVEGVSIAVTGVAGVPEAWYDGPTFYFSNPHTIVGPDVPVPFPARSEARDFELEVACVVGPDEEIFGYTLLNDWSARDLQGREMQVSLGPAKGKDFATTLGPWIVTADELEPYRDAEGFLDLGCTASVNGEVVGEDRLANMGWTFETMVAYAARDSRVVAGDVLGSGTVGHGGCLAELWGRRGEQDPPPLEPGDVVTLTVEGIGSLTNTVAVAEPAPPLPPVRRRDHATARAAHPKKEA